MGRSSIAREYVDVIDGTHARPYWHAPTGKQIRLHRQWHAVATAGCWVCRWMESNGFAVRRSLRKVLR